MDSRRQRAFRALLLSLAACGCVAAVYSAGTAQATGRNRRAHTAEINAAALAGAAPLTPNQKALVARAARSEKDGWILLHIEGDARARGFQHGYLLATETAVQVAADGGVQTVTCQLANMIHMIDDCIQGYILIRVAGSPARFEHP